MPQDHELLGVEATAAPGEIRAAYVALLKRAHPDICGSTNAAPQVSELVRAYRRLRDAAARRRSLSFAAHTSLTTSRLLPVPAPRRRPASLVLWGKIWLLALIGGASAFVSLIAFPEARWETRRVSATPAPPEPMPLEAAELDQGLVLQAVGALQSFGPREGTPAVEAHSRRCFAELADAPDLRLLDYCIAFDIAATHTFAVSSAPVVEEGAFFHPAELSERHASALRLLIADAGARIMRHSTIEAQTMSALASAVNVNDLALAPR